MGNCARRWAVLSLFAIAAGGCEPAATARVSVEPPPGLDIAGTELIVYDGAECEAGHAVGGTELERVAMATNATATFTVGAGQLSFAAVGFDGDAELARGCSTAVLEPGEVRDLSVSLADTTCFGDSARTVDFGDTYAGDTVGGAHYFRVFLEREFTPAIVTIATEMPAGGIDTAVSVRGTCDTQSTELLSAQLPPFPSTLEIPVLESGDIYLLVDSAKRPGAYELQVVLFVDRVF